MTPADTPSAVLASAVKGVLRDRLREAGFVGGPRTYFRPYPEVWLCLRVNTTGSLASASFTGDFGVSSRTLLKARGLDPQKRPPPREWHYEQRIGSLLNDQFDRWWTIRSGQTIQEAESVVSDFADACLQAVPAVSSLLSDRGLLEAWRAEIAFLSPPEVGDLHDLERAIGEEPTPVVARARDDEDMRRGVSRLALALTGLIGSSSGDQPGGTAEVSAGVSVSDPNAALRKGSRSWRRG